MPPLLLGRRTLTNGKGLEPELCMLPSNENAVRNRPDTPLPTWSPKLVAIERIIPWTEHTEPVKDTEHLEICDREAWSA